MSVKREFRAWQRDHYNFMTPRIEKLWVKDDLVVELSSGSPFLGKAIRGVTAYRFNGVNFDPVDLGLNKGFSGDDWEVVEAEATEYAETLFYSLLDPKGDKQ